MAPKIKWATAGIIIILFLIIVVLKVIRNHIIRALKKGLIPLAAVMVIFLLLHLFFPLPDNIEYSVIVTDNKNEVVHAYLTSDQKWRMKTQLEEISPLLRKTIVQKEDRYFYTHPGVNFFAIGRALAKNIFYRKRTSGASTITMQVARALEPKSRTWLHKAVEMFRAFQLEIKYSKNEILQLYLNLVPYGSNIEGVKSASVLYFRKSPDHLSLAEITALSIIPNRPSSLVVGKNNDRIVTERNRWLRRFARQRIFTEKEIEDALSEPLTVTRTAAPALLPHLSYKLKQRGGDIIHTNINLNMQLKVEKLVQDYIRSLYIKNIRNAATIVIDNATHRVITYVGSADFRDTLDAGQVNGAAAIRQPGSTLKPLLYGLCIDEGLLTPKTVVTDVAINYSGYAPENYDKTFNGYVSMEYALEHSLNIPAVKSLRAAGKNKLVAKLADCHFEQIKKDQRKLGLSMILGGCGASLEELAGLYSMFANNGVYSQLAFTQDETKPGKRMLSTGSSFMISEILSKVNRPDFPLNWQSTERMPKIAWKTGTSYGRRDAWSIGYNKKYTVGIWTGNFSGVGIPELSGANVATPLLFKIFNSIDYDSDESWFEQPADCDSRLVCSETGLVPGEACKDLVMDYFLPLVSATRRCDHLQEIMVSADEKISYCRSCMPVAGYKKKTFKLISPEMQAYFEDNRIVYDKIPAHNAACEKVFREGSPVITFPSDKSEYLISKISREPLQLTCNVSNDVSKVYWYINDKFYKAASTRTKQFFVPDEGPVKISCTDDKGRNRDIWISVKYVDL